MVASGVGVTVLPCTAACAERFSERLVAVRRFAEEPPQRRVALAWRKSFPRPRAIDLLKGAIRACSLSCVQFVDGVPEWPTRQ
jgi:LysR family hydrogen peroxide-inducible transcriptional activator